MSSLHEVRVVVAGGGLAGLTAADELSRRGVGVHVVEARATLGGRVRTDRDADGIHAEAGGEFIDQPHDAIRGLASEPLRQQVARLARVQLIPESNLFHFCEPVE